jgi:hypothetical protein
MFCSHNGQQCFYDLIFGIVLANSLVYEAYFVVGDFFCGTIRAVYAYLLFMSYFLVYD